MPVDSLTATTSTVLHVPYSDGTAVGFAALHQDQVAITYLRGSLQNPNVDWVTFTLDGQEKSEAFIPNSGEYQTTPVISVNSSGGYGEFGVVQRTPNGQRILFNEQSASFVNNPKYGLIVGPAAGTVYLEVGVYPSATGFHLEWITSTPNGLSLNQENVDANGVVAGSLTQTSSNRLAPYAGTMVGATAFTVQDNQAQLNGNAPVTLPGEAPGAVSGVFTQGLATNTGAAVAWVDSGGGHEALFDAASNSFRLATTLGSGRISDLHMVALPDGSYVVSWTEGGRHEGEVFNARGEGGGVITLAGAVAGVTSQGNLYTVGTETSGPSAGKPFVTQYAIGQEGAALVRTSDANYMAPDTAMVIYLTGSNQTVTANNSGDIIWSNDSGNHLIGGTGADTFHLGRGGDVITSGGGADTFDLAEIPWAGGQITGFQAGDVLDLTGLISTTADTGTDGFADGYLKITDDGRGDAQVWAQYATSGSSSGWWLVETLNGVAASKLSTSGDQVTLSADTSGGGSSGGGSGRTFTSDNNGDHWTGTAGNDTFNLGRGGDVVAGAGGADLFKFAETPWAGAEITDFSSDDTVDLSGLLAKSGYAGSDPVADGYIKITDDGHGSAQVWSNLDKVQAGLGWYSVATLDDVGPTAVRMQGDTVVMTGGAPSGQTYTSDNNGDHWTGTDGADTFNLGRGGDVVTSLGGADLFKFAETPWAGAEITDFSTEDTVDLTGLLAKSGYTGADAVADGYIKITDDGHGDGQVWSNLDKVQAGLGWYLVVTTDHVAGSSLHMEGAFITG